MVATAIVLPQLVGANPGRVLRPQRDPDVEVSGNDGKIEIVVS